MSVPRAARRGGRVTEARRAVLAWLSSMPDGYEAADSQVYQLLLVQLGRSDSEYVLGTLVGSGHLARRKTPRRAVSGRAPYLYRLARRKGGGA